MLSNANWKRLLAAAAIVLAPATATADPTASGVVQTSAGRVHVDLGLFDTMVDARRAWKHIVGADETLLRLAPIFGRHQDQTTANVFFIAPADAAAVCAAAQRSAADTCKLFD